MDNESQLRRPAHTCRSKFFRELPHGPATFSGKEQTPRVWIAVISDF
jgi:hypothetical protein